MSEIWGIILAAGESKRMGKPKMLMSYRGKTIIESVIDKVAGSNVDKLMVVLGSSGNEIEKIIISKPVKCCFNENYHQGMLSSVKCGLRSLPGGFGAALIFLGDQPMVEISVINSVIDAWRHSGKGIVIPVTGNKRGHPLLIESRYRVEIETLDLQESLRTFIQRFSDDVQEIEVNASSILKDIDTLEDYNNELQQMT